MNSFKSLACLFMLLVFVNAGASPPMSTGTVTLPAISTPTTGSPVSFVRETFAVPFTVPPVVVPMPNTDAAVANTAASVRIVNVTTTHFDIIQVEPACSRTVARCAPYDGAHPSMTVDYIALEPGVHTLGNGDTIEAGTLDTKTVQHRIAGGPTEGWDNITTTVSNPVIVGYVQTINNGSAFYIPSASNPQITGPSSPFITTAFRTNGGTLQAALELSEVNDNATGLPSNMLANTETLGWIAFQGNTVGTSRSGMFTDGSGATVGYGVLRTPVGPGDIGIEGTTDTSTQEDGTGTNPLGCHPFTVQDIPSAQCSNPVIIGSPRTHNGGDGGWLRQCSESPIADGIGNFDVLVGTFYDEDQDRDNGRGHPANEGASLLVFCSSVTNPVTLSYIRTKTIGDQIKFDWETSTETFNFGFNLWGQVEGEWYRLNERVIPSRGTDSLTPKRYKSRVNVSELPGVVEKVGISSVELNGHEEFYGPYEPGEEAGEETLLKPIAWDEIVNEASQKLRDFGYNQVGRNWVKSAEAPESLSGILAEIRLEEAGLYRVTHADLTDQGIDLTGINVSEIALTREGESVARHVHAKQETWGQKSHIEFLAKTVTAKQALHTLEAVYRLELDSTKVQDTGRVNRTPKNASTKHVAKSRVNRQFEYSIVAPRPDPWFEKYMLVLPGGSGTPGYSHEFDMVINADNVSPQSEAELKVRLITVTDQIPGVDHQVEVWQIRQDGSEVLLTEAVSDGYGELIIVTSIPPGTLADGDNTFRIRLKEPRDEQGNLPPQWQGGGVYVDSYELSYERFGVATNNSVRFSGPASQNTESDGYRIQGFSEKSVVAYAESNDNLTRLKTKTRQTNNGGYTVEIAEVAEGEANYYLATTSSLRTPVINLPIDIDDESLDASLSDYLIISHPVFIDRLTNPNGEQDFVAAKQDQGYNVKVIDSETIMQVYGHGMRTPEAINAYLKAAKVVNPDLRHVLLVGYASRDPNDYLGSGSWNFIPTMYTSTHELMNFAPSDGLLADIDGDLIQDVSLGRWTVRTTADLNTVISKTLKYQETGGANSLRKALLTSDISEPGQDYAAQIDRIGEQIAGTNDSWDITKIYREGNPNAGWELVEAINQGQSIVSYAGHGGPTIWSYSGLFNQGAVNLLNNEHAPTVILTLTCYTTYYVSEALDTLGNQFLISTGEDGADRGAVALFGSSVLSGYDDNETVVSRVLEYMLRGVDTDSDGTPGRKTLGEAIVRAKQELGVIPATIAGNLMGDPSITISP